MEGRGWGMERGAHQGEGVKGRGSCRCYVANKREGRNINGRAFFVSIR